ncbi:MAG: hypothetical protein XXXJIFNMEKO3_02722 [Candidatus Erwinia impunctatus]|nr:hypothetical protein XXXJIFNMEKO_02722 [Culicoides impunctatus]
MDFYGLFIKYKLNRSLNAQERACQLHQDRALNLLGGGVENDTIVIAINSYYLEIVDKFYPFKGVVGFIAGGWLYLSFNAYLSISYTRLVNIGLWNSSWNGLLSYLAVSILLISVIIFSFKILKCEWFARTHYPMRFDRKNRLVHVIRLDGTAFSAEWDKLFITYGVNHPKLRHDSYYISCHVLAENNRTVVETFCLPFTSDLENLLRHWEFVRLFMDKGPELIIDSVDICLPIAKKREGFWLGLYYWTFCCFPMPFILVPVMLGFGLIFSIPRYIAMQTSRIPQWPKEIELLCQPEKDDPYFRDASMNPKNLWWYGWKKSLHFWARLKGNKK